MANKKRAKFNRSSKAAKKGWITRRANLEFNRRSKAAKKGWITQRSNLAKKKRKQRKHRKLPEVTITRLTYKPPPSKGGRLLHIEVEKRDGRITRISIDDKTYTKEGDIQALESLLETSEPDDDRNS
jgi:hypothetical protein